MKGFLRGLGIALIVLLLVLALAAVAGQNGALSGWLPEKNLLLAFLVLFLLGVFLLALLAALRTGHSARAPVSPVRLAKDEVPVPVPLTDLAALKHALVNRFKWRWKHRLPWLLLTGEARDGENIAPGLTTQGWQIIGQAVLVWGGDLAHGGHTPDLLALRQLRRYRPVEAIVMVSHEAQWSQPHHIAALQRGLHQTHAILGWVPPCYLVSIDSEPARAVLPEALAMTLTDRPFTPQTLDTLLTTLPSKLNRQGMAQLLHNIRHDFLLRLSAWFHHGGKVRLLQALTPLLSGWMNPSLHGVLFTTPQPAGSRLALHETSGTPLWNTLAVHARRLPGRAVDITLQAVLRWTLAGLLLLWLTGLIFSWFANVRLVQLAGTAISRASVVTTPATLSALEENLSALLRQQGETPWYRRFGMDVSDRLISHLWSTWTQVSRAQIVLPAQRALQARLRTGAPKYDDLKTYLMLANPEHNRNPADQAFLAGQLQALLPSVPADPLYFFARELAPHPAWRMVPEYTLIAQARKALLEQMSGPEAETRLYRSLLESASRNYADLTLMQLLDGQSAEEMFSLNAEIPGSFTREAWDGHVAGHIASLVATREEQTGWVLADAGQLVADTLSPQALGNRLTDRYLADFGIAWQSALNQLQAVPSPDPVTQLTLAADRNISPQAALLKTLAWQGLTASPDEHQKQVNSTLAPVFGGVVTMMYGGNKAGITLTAWQSQAARLRDRLRSLSAFRDGRAALSQSVFNGTQIDNGIAELPARLGAQLGDGWQPMARALFIAPLSQTLQGIMKTGVQEMNLTWQREIVIPWRKAFDNTFPFTASPQDASLADLNDFINPESGKIAGFISQHLKGVVEYRSGRWQAADKLPPGLVVSLPFLRQLNRLDSVGRILFDKSWGVTFQLQAGSARDVVQTELAVDGQKLRYFNQIPEWQSFRWPGDTYLPGASLVWTSVRTGARLYFDTPGAWAFYRLLAKAKVTPVDNQHYRLTWTADDGLPLNYQLAFIPGNDPVNVLDLQGFVLPVTLFK